MVYTGRLFHTDVWSMWNSREIKVTDKAPKNLDTKGFRQGWSVINTNFIYTVIYVYYLRCLQSHFLSVNWYKVDLSGCKTENYINSSREEQEISRRLAEFMITTRKLIASTAHTLSVMARSWINIHDRGLWTHYIYVHGISWMVHGRPWHHGSSSMIFTLDWSMICHEAQCNQISKLR